MVIERSPEQQTFAAIDLDMWARRAGARWSSPLLLADGVGDGAEPQAVEDAPFTGLDALLAPTMAVTMVTSREEPGDVTIARRSWFGSPERLHEIRVDGPEVGIGAPVSLVGVGGLIEVAIEELSAGAQPGSLDAIEEKLTQEGVSVVRLADGADLSELANDSVRSHIAADLIRVAVVSFSPADSVTSLWETPSLTLAVTDAGVFEVRTARKVASLTAFEPGSAARFLADACDALLRPVSTAPPNWPSHMASWKAAVFQGRFVGHREAD